jgi:acetylglutamate/LysW-gamma-L-alpha-aminoadipate kinase
MLIVKVGGGEGVNTEVVCADVAALVKSGQPVVLVHGGSHATNTLSEQLGHPPRIVTSQSGHSSRYTDRETLEIFLMATAGKINKLLVERLQQLGVNAVGLSGIDGRLLEAERKSTLRIVEEGKRKILHGEYSGQIDKVNPGLLTLLLDAGYTPVIAPQAISHESEALNVDGDRAAAALAAALHADTLVILTNVPGLLRDITDPASLIPTIPAAQAPDYLERYAQGRMKRKVLGAVEALEDGVGKVILADGRIESPVQRALSGQGTVIQ